MADTDSKSSGRLFSHPDAIERARAREAARSKDKPVVSEKPVVSVELVAKGAKLKVKNGFTSQGEVEEEGGDGGIWEDGSIGAAFGTFLSDLIGDLLDPESNTEWVGDIISSVVDYPDVKNNRLNVMVFYEDLLDSEFYFLNAYMWKAKRDGLEGWLNGAWYVVVFECAWFVAYGDTDERTSSQLQWTYPDNDHYAINGNGQRICITRPLNSWRESECYTAKDILEYDDSSGHDFKGIQGKLNNWTSDDTYYWGAIRSNWNTSHWDIIDVFNQ